jgi:phosphoserine phosphatase
MLSFQPVQSPVFSVTEDVLASAAALRECQPEAQPVAFWDFDGTLFEGDCSEGFSSLSQDYIPGLVEKAIAAGWSGAYPAAGGYGPCWRDYQDIMSREGTVAAYPWLVRLFAGAPEAALTALAVEEFTTRLRSCFFPEALEIWHRLEAAGVHCQVISASADFFIKGAAPILRVPPERLHGLRLVTGPDGLLTTQPLEPLTIGQGKAALLRALIATAGPGTPYPIAAFGNDFFTDGPMLEAVACTTLPAGSPVAALVNAKPPSHAAGRFRELTFTRRHSS